MAAPDIEVFDRTTRMLFFIMKYMKLYSGHTVGSLLLCTCTCLCGTDYLDMDSI